MTFGNITVEHLRGGLRISGMGVHVYKGVGVRFADFISFFLERNQPPAPPPPRRF